MIGSLRGILLDRLDTGEALVEVGGVGYRVMLAAPTLAALGELGEAVFLHVHTHVREDAIILYGFSDRDQRSCFEALIGAHGVGPSLALAILSIHRPSALRRAVMTGDADALVMVPGVGAKTAARLLIELEARLDLPPDRGEPGPEGGAKGAVGEVRAALAGLGYGPDEVHLALRALPYEGAVEDLLRAALRELAGAR